MKKRDGTLKRRMCAKCQEAAEIGGRLEAQILQKAKLLVDESQRPTLVVGALMIASYHLARAHDLPPERYGQLLDMLRWLTVVDRKIEDAEVELPDEP